MAKKSVKASTARKGRASKKRKDLKMRRSVMGTLSLLLMLTAVIVALIPVPKAAAVLNNDEYEVWNGDAASNGSLEKHYIAEATCPTGNWVNTSVYTRNDMLIFADATGALRVSDDPLGGGVVVAYNEDGAPQSSLDIPEQMPAYRYNASFGGYIAADSQGRFLYYYTDDGGTGMADFVPCKYDASLSSQPWNGKQLYALTALDNGNPSTGLATEPLTSYTGVSISGNGIGTIPPANTPSQQHVVNIKYIGQPDYKYEITLGNSNDVDTYHSDGHWTQLADDQLEGIFEGKMLSSLTIPSTIIAVGDQAFKDCRNLTSVAFSKGVAAIGNRAFKGCISLSTVDLAQGTSTNLSYLTNIGDEAFSGCTALGNFELPTTVQCLGNFAFCDCKALTGPNLVGDGTSNLQVVGNGLFYGCESMTQIELPSGVKLSGYGSYNTPDGSSDNAVHLMFYGCSALEDLILPEYNRASQAFRYDNVTGCNGLHMVKCENFSMEFDCPDHTDTPCSYINDQKETFGHVNLGRGYFNESEYEVPSDFYIESACQTTDPVYQYALRHKLAFHSLTNSMPEYYDTYCKLWDGYIYYAKMTADPNAQIIKCLPLNAASPSSNVIIPENIGPCQITEIAAG
ncbi:MAG: leucine-rich repeat domain-containing protein, partial [Lachnospiraceae bacterium]|nr:leucine-rich repeat domain-containing protein [Lachnospiraceae bacterium]